MKRKRRAIFHGLLAGFWAAALSLALWAPGWLDGWEDRVWDQQVRYMAEPGPTTDDVSIILLDQNSLDWVKKELGQGWMWPRELYTPIIDFCRRQGAKALVFDVLFSEPSQFGVSDDDVLGRSITSFGPFVGAFTLSNDEGSAIAWPDKVPVPGIEAGGLEVWLAANRPKGVVAVRAAFPIEEVAENSRLLGNANHSPDPDSVYRKCGFFSLFDGMLVPSLGLAAYLAGNPKARLALSGRTLAVDGIPIPLDRDGKALLNYRGPSGTHATFSAAQVIQSELRLREGGLPPIKGNVFKDKYVIFGFSAPGLKDLRPAPVSGVYPGTEIWATMLDNILSGDFIAPASGLAVTLLALALALLGGVGASLVRRPVLIGILFACFSPLPVGLSLWAYSGQLRLPLVTLEASLVFSFAIAGLINQAVEGRQKRFIKGAFGQYLSPQVIEQLIQNPERLKLGGERRELSIFFSDIQGFTSISEGLGPEELTSFLNDYLTAMTGIIYEEGGTVDKFEGDAIIAFWNAPLDQPDHAARCVRAAVRCQEKLDGMRPAFRERLGREVHMRIGVNTGPAVVGNLGSHSRFDYTMLGDSVNLAARLEGLNKAFGTYTMVSENTLDRFEDFREQGFSFRELARVGVVGRKAPVRVYEPLRIAEMEKKRDDLGLFIRGLAAFYHGRFEQALEFFGPITPHDPAAASYASKCESLLADPPKEWEGVWRMTSK